MYVCVRVWVSVFLSFFFLIKLIKISVRIHWLYIRLECVLTLTPECIYVCNRKIKWWTRKFCAILIKDPFHIYTSHKNETVESEEQHWNRENEGWNGKNIQTEILLCVNPIRFILFFYFVEICRQFVEIFSKLVVVLLIIIVFGYAFIGNSLKGTFCFFIVIVKGIILTWQRK